MALQESDLFVIYRPTDQNHYKIRSSEISSGPGDNATESAAGIVRLATEAEVIAGTDNSITVSPKNLMLALADADYPLDAGDYDGNVTFNVPLNTGPAAPDPATETDAGIVRLATSTETIDGVDGTIAISPLNLKIALADSSYVLDGGIYAS